MKKFLITLALLCGFAGCRPFFFFELITHPRYRDVSRAKRLAEEKKYDEAVALYREHIEDRAADPKRPDWENPYFYLLMIGDIRLEQGDYKASISSYDEAARRKVEKELVGDRYLRLAEWLTKRGKLHEATQVLQRYRDYDPLLFDAMLDEVSRKIVEEEDRR